MSSLKKKKIKSIILLLLTIAAAVVFVCSAVGVVKELGEYAKGKHTYDQITEDMVFFREINDEESDLLEEAPISVDFEALKSQNSDVVGWLYCADTPINYPVLQSSDNSYYLRRMVNKEYNIAGSVFMDFRSKADCTSANTIIYGHNMKNDSMFGTLTEYQNSGYYSEHSVLWYLTAERDYKIELLAGCVLDAYDELYNADFSDEELVKIVEQYRKKSSFSSDVEISFGDRIATLSTCSYEYSGARYVLIGKLTPLNEKLVSSK